MPVPFGFSVGDCISVCILIKDAIHALDSSRGSSAEYQTVIHELWALDRALLEVVNLAQSFDTTVELNALTHTTRRTAEQCKSCIEAFLGKIKEYEASLRAGGSGNRLRDVKGKVGWALCGREHLVKFRTEINGHSSAINMLLITASVSLTKLNDKNLQERMVDARQANEATANEQLVVLGQVKDILDTHTKTLQAQDTTAMRLKERMKYFFTLGADLKAFMARIWTLNFRSYRILLDLQTRVPREFEPCWIQEALILTDALGRVAPIHLELINSWDVLESVLTARFKNIPGERKVRQGEYALQDRGSLRDIKKSQAFEASFLPGRKVDMSIIFKQSHTLVRSCPGCLLETEEDNAIATTCKNCGLWFQRIEEVVEQQQQKPSPVEPVFRATERPTTPSTTTSRSPSPEPKRLGRKRKIRVVEEDMSMFKRVRLLQRRYSLSHFGDLAPASGHKQSQKGTGQMGRDVRRSRSRNTTPSLASTGAHDEAGYTAYLELPIGHFRTSEDYIVYYGNEGFEEFYGTAIPSSELLEGLLERLERLVEVVETRRSVCDKGTRMVAQMRKDRLEEIEIERRDEERKLRDIAEEEERGRNKGNKANKIKKRKDRSTREERPLQYGSHGLTLQDGRNIGESSWFYPPPSRDDDSASSSLSPVAVATPVALGMDIDDDSASSSLSPVSVATPSAAGMDIIDEDTASEEEHGRPEAKRARWE